MSLKYDCSIEAVKVTRGKIVIFKNLIGMLQSIVSFVHLF